MLFRSIKGIDFRVVRDEFDAFDPLDLLEAELDLVAEPQRCPMSERERLVVLVAADDYEETGELVAVIRGSDGGRHMYGAGDALPDVYEERFRTQMYSERVVFAGVWNKAVVVAGEDDEATMLNHALIQGRRRYRR